jgi:hypothetical protein
MTNKTARQVPTAQVPDSDEWEYRESPSLTVYDNESNPVIGCVLGPDGDVLRVVRAWKPFPFVFHPSKNREYSQQEVVRRVLK